MKNNRKRKKKIAFFGNFGQGNLGNESTLRAILDNLRRHFPDAEVNCICTGPEATATTHNIAAVPMHDIVAPGLLRKNSLTRVLRKVFMRVPMEIYRWFRALKTLKGTDMLIVPGTQFLSDNLTSPFGWPYMAFKWSVASKLRGCKLLFVSVGVGPLRHPLSRLLVKAALLLADYRSYRDDCSKQYMRSLGFDTTNDPVYPDLAFSLRTPTLPRDSQNDRAKLIIAVGVKDYHGQYGPRPLQHQADEIYRHYIHNMMAFVGWLLEHMYTVRLIIGDMSYDTQVVEDLKRSLNERRVQWQTLQVIHEPIESVEQLVSQLTASDIVVSSRFHNVVLGLLLQRPVIALSYHEKFTALMNESDLAKYNLPIEHLDPRAIIDTFLELERNRDQLTLHISSKVEKYRTALDDQYRVIFRDDCREEYRFAV